MKTTELIDKLSELAGIQAYIVHDSVVVYARADSRLYTAIFNLPIEAWSVTEGTFYAENLGETSLVTIGAIANLLDEYVKTPPKDRSEPKYYRFFSSAPILADSNYKYLAVNLNNGDYVLTCKNPVLNNFHTIFSEERKHEMEAKGLLVGFEPEEIK